MQTEWVGWKAANRCGLRKAIGAQVDIGGILIGIISVRHSQVGHIRIATNVFAAITPPPSRTGSGTRRVFPLGFRQDVKSRAITTP